MAPPKQSAEDVMQEIVDRLQEELDNIESDYDLELEDGDLQTLSEGQDKIIQVYEDALDRQYE